MDFTKLKNYMDRLINEYNVPGLDCSVYKNHEEVFRYYSGVSDIENNRKMKGDELYVIYSMTKMITCTCALQLYEQGKFLMSDPISKYLPEFEKMKIAAEGETDKNAALISTGKTVENFEETSEIGYAQNPITIKDLFTMCGGLDYNLNSDPIKKAKAEGKTTTREIVGAFADTVLGFEPGTRFRYSLCHDVLGALIEVLSGKKLGDYMRDNLFESLGMNDTFFGVPKGEALLSRAMRRYRYDENGKVLPTPLECPFNITDEYQSGGAGLTSTTHDYAVFLDALANGGMGYNGYRILSSASVTQMGTNHLTGKAYDDFDNGLRKGYGYGLGVRVHTDKARSGSLSPIGEFGWDGAAGAFSMVDTKNKLAFVYFQEVLGWDLRIQTEMRNALYSCLD